MVRTIPGDVDKTNERAFLRSRRRPAETVRTDLVPPSALWVAAVGHHKVEHLLVRQQITPREDSIFEAVAHI